MGCCFCCIRKWVERLDERVDNKFSESQIIAKEIFWANLRYQRSQVGVQIQGNGALVLTPDVLWFSLLLPNKEIEMPLRNIRSVEAGRFFRQQNYLTLTVEFVDATSGIEDQVVIALRDPEYWKNMIIGHSTGHPGTLEERELEEREERELVLRTLEERVNENFAQGQIIAKVLWADLRYQKSAGKFQIQGNGALVLTSHVLWFNLFSVPNKQIEMPLRNIRAVQIGRIRRQGEQPALFVDFVDPFSGIEDQVVIQLQEFESWKRMIDENIKKQLQLQFLDPRFTL